jgi:uncharacterized membrane protein (DUF485 family)
MAKRKKQINITFSHVLAIIFVVLYVTIVLLVTGMWIWNRIEGVFLLEAISMPVMTIVTGYFTKAGIENWSKINNNNKNNHYDTEAGAPPEEYLDVEDYSKDIIFKADSDI